MSMLENCGSATCEITEGSWKDFRDDVKNANLEMFNIIEALSPSDKYKIIKARYLYGEKITDSGVICVPSTMGKLSRLDDCNVSQKLKDQLGYCSTPLMLQLSRSAEVFLEPKNRTIPLNVFTAGDLFGLFEACTPITNCPSHPYWTITAGIRSIFLGAKISDTIGHKALRIKYGVSNQPPKKLVDQWETLKIIGNRSNPIKPWACDILIFTKDWFEKKPKDYGWLQFHHYLLVKSWIQSKGARARFEYDGLIWEDFADFICKRNLKPGPYIIDTVKHLLLIANGSAPSFKPINNDDEMLAPTKAIETAYSEDYGLKYAPIIMGPCIFNPNNPDSCIYYSLSYPTLLEGTPAIRYAPSIISELQEVRTLMILLKQVLMEKSLLPFYDTIKDIELRYFHDDEDKFGELCNSGDIEKHDPLLREMLETRFKGKEFPTHGQFFRGCVIIAKRDCQE